MLFSLLYLTLVTLCKIGSFLCCHLLYLIIYLVCTKILFVADLNRLNIVLWYFWFIMGVQCSVTQIYLRWTSDLLQVISVFFIKCPWPGSGSIFFRADPGSGSRIWIKQKWILFIGSNIYFKKLLIVLLIQIKDKKNISFWQLYSFQITKIFFLIFFLYSN